MQRIHPMGSQKKLQLSKGRTQESLQEAEQARTRADNAKRLMTLTESTKKLGMKKTTPLGTQQDNFRASCKQPWRLHRSNFVRSAGSPRPHRIPVAAGSTSCTYASVPWSKRFAPSRWDGFYVELARLGGPSGVLTLLTIARIDSARNRHDR